MIFTVKKALIKERYDYKIAPVDDDMSFYVCSLKKGFYLYTQGKKQVGQIVFKNNVASMTAPDGSTLQLVRHEDGMFSIGAKQFGDDEKKDVREHGEGRVNKDNFITVGKPWEYTYSVYEKNGKLPELAMQVIPDVEDENYYRVRICGGRNALKLAMLALCFDTFNYL